jgi:hypothetical protein
LLLHAEQLLHHVAIDLFERGDLLLEPQVVALGASEGGKCRHHRVVCQVDSFEGSQELQMVKGEFGVRDLIHVQPQFLKEGAVVEV